MLWHRKSRAIGEKEAKEKLVINQTFFCDMVIKCKMR